MTSRKQRVDLDSPWKEIIEHYFPEFMAFFFPQIHADIDWTRGYEFLDKELQRVVRDAQLGRRFADKLIKVWRKSGEEQWVLIHIEVQNQPETEFGKRMYTYNHRLFDKYNRPIVSLAVLSDERRRWRPKKYSYDLWGCKISFMFPMVKLLDYAQRWAELESSTNSVCGCGNGSSKSASNTPPAAGTRVLEAYLDTSIVRKRLRSPGYSQSISFY